MDKHYCIFDMDGTLTDSMPYWKALGRDYLRSKGVEPDESLLWMVKTMTMAESARYFMDAFHIPGPPERIVAEMEAVMEARYKSDIPLKPGVPEYLEALRAKGTRLCVATATAVPLAEACFRRLGVAECFDFILSCEDISRSKEYPDIFLLAAERFQVMPSDCAVYEDACYAARTAKNAGFYTVGVYEESGAAEWPELKALSDKVILDWREAL